MYNLISDFCSNVSTIILLLGLPAIVIWFIVSFVKKKNWKNPLKAFGISIVAIIVLSLVGSSAWTKTEDYQEYLAEEEIKAKEEAKKLKEQEEKTKLEKEEENKETPTPIPTETVEVTPTATPESTKEPKATNTPSPNPTERKVNNIFYGEINLNLEQYIGEKVAFSFKCEYVSSDKKVEKVITDSNLCYGSIEVNFKNSEKIKEEEYITVSGIIEKEHSHTILKDAIIIDSGEQAKKNYDSEFENYKNSFSDAESVSYNDLLRYPDKYKNKKMRVEVDIKEVESDGVIFNGSIRGVVPSTEDEIIFYDYRDDREPRVIEGDKLIVYGIGNGTVTMKIKEDSGLLAKTIDKYEVPCIYIQFVEFR